MLYVHTVCIFYYSVQFSLQMIDEMLRDTKYT